MERLLSVFLAAAAALGLMVSSGCSIKKLALNNLGDALAESGSTYASDEDPELIRDALPFTLKLLETFLDQSPEHTGLLKAAASGFTQYAFAFIHQDADEADDEDFREAQRLRARARNLYIRGRDYSLRGLEIAHPGFTEILGSNAAGAAAMAQADDVPLLYWTAASWGLAISVAKDDPNLIADLGTVEILIHRALTLEEDYDHGVLHEFMISLDGGRSEAMGGSARRAREHFRRAVKLSEGKRASPYVALAESVSVGNQDKAEFVSLIEKALAIDPDSRPEWRLNNLVVQHRARWLKERLDLLFAE